MFTTTTKICVISNILLLFKIKLHSWKICHLRAICEIKQQKKVREWNAFINALFNISHLNDSARKIGCFYFVLIRMFFNICAPNNSGTDELFLLLAWQNGQRRAFLCGWSLVPVQLGLRLFYISYNDDVARLQSELEKQPHKYHLPNNVLCQKNIWYCRYYLTKLLLKPCMQMQYNVFMVSNRFLNVKHRTCSI